LIYRFPCGTCAWKIRHGWPREVWIVWWRGR
jgi:hypothetical protein